MRLNLPDFNESSSNVFSSSTSKLNLSFSRNKAPNPGLVRESKISANNWDHFAPFSFALDQLQLLWIFAATSTIVFCVCANLFTILILVRCSPLKSISTLYILSLSLADCLIGSLVMPLMLVNQIGDTRIGLAVPLWLCKVWQLADVTLTTISLYSICAIALDRVWNLEKPLRVFKRSRRQAKRLIIYFWLFPTLVWALVFAFSSGQLHSDSCALTRKDAFRAYLVAIPVLYIPAIILIAAFIRISFAVSRHFKFLREHSSRALAHLTSSVSSAALNQRPMSAASASSNLRLSRLKALDSKGFKSMRIVDNLSTVSSTLPRSYMLTPPSSPCSPRFPRSLEWAVGSIKMPSDNDETITGWTCGPMILIGEYETEKASRSNSSKEEKENCKSEELPARQLTDTDNKTRCLDVQAEGRASVMSTQTNESAEIHEIITNKSCVPRKERLFQKLSNTLQRHGSSRFSMITIPNNIGELLQREGISQQMKAAKAVGFILFCFLICWFPFLIAWPVRVFCPTCLSNDAYNISIWLNYMCSTLNPVLYALSNPKVLMAIKGCGCCTILTKKKSNSNVTFV